MWKLRSHKSLERVFHSVRDLLDRRYIRLSDPRDGSTEEQERARLRESFRTRIERVLREARAAIRGRVSWASTYVVGGTVRRTIRRRMATVDLDGDVARVVVLEGREVLAWGTAVVKEGGDPDPAARAEEPANQLAALFSDLRCSDSPIWNQPFSALSWRRCRRQLWCR